MSGLTHREASALLERSLPLLRKRCLSAGRALPQGWDQEDLVQQSAMWVWKQLLRYDSARGMKPSSWVVTLCGWAAHAVLDRAEPGSVTVAAQRRHLYRLRLRLEHELHREPTRAELAEAAGLKVNAAAFSAPLVTVPLDTPMPGVDATLAEALPDEGPSVDDLAELARDREALLACVGQLDARGRRLVMEYYWRGREVGPELAAEFGISRQGLDLARRSALFDLAQLMRRWRRGWRPPKRAARRRSRPSSEPRAASPAGCSVQGCQRGGQLTRGRCKTCARRAERGGWSRLDPQGDEQRWELRLSQSAAARLAAGRGRAGDADALRQGAA